MGSDSRAVLNTLQLLEALGGRGAVGMNLSELSRTCSIPKATASRYLATLVDEGYATRDANTSAYRLGARVFGLSRQFYEQSETLLSAREHLSELAAAAGETAHIAVLQVPNVVYIDVAESPQRVRAFVTRGESLPAHCVAAGRAMLAHSRSSVVESVLERGLQAFTSNTIADRETFLAEIAETRRRGFSAVVAEWRHDVFGISAPLFSLDRAVVGAIGVSCPIVRIDPAKIEVLGEIVATTATRISQGQRKAA